MISVEWTSLLSRSLKKFDAIRFLLRRNDRVHSCLTTHPVRPALYYFRMSNWSAGRTLTNSQLTTHYINPFVLGK